MVSVFANGKIWFRAYTSYLGTGTLRIEARLSKAAPVAERAPRPARPKAPGCAPGDPGGSGGGHGGAQRTKCFSKGFMAHIT